MAFESTAGWLTTRQVSEMIGLSPARILQLITKGRLRPAERDEKGGWRIDPLFAIYQPAPKKPKPKKRKRKRKKKRKPHTNPVVFDTRLILSPVWRKKVKVLKIKGEKNGAE